MLYRHLLSLPCLLLLSPWLWAEAPTVPDSAIDGWRRLEATASGVAGRCHYTNAINDDTGLGVHWSEDHFKFASDDQQICVAGTRDGKRSVIAVNPKYGFTLSGPDHDNDYQRKRLVKGKQREKELARAGEAIFPLLHAGYTICGKSLISLVEDHEATTIHSLDIDPQTKVATLKFTYNAPVRPADTLVTGGTICLATDDDWRILSYDCETRWGTLAGHVQYQTFRSSVVPSHVTVTVRPGSAMHVGVSTYELESIEPLQAGQLKNWLKDYRLEEPTP
ncbi:hypothetical protein [Bremerella cremea]|uniref:hypothetical protein n=1 Tax=Bremerella cremea TaxID=1031537 RepID=UPI0031E704D2